MRIRLTSEVFVGHLAVSAVDPIDEPLQKAVDYLSVFGKLEVRRAYFDAPGSGGKTPLDQALSLPSRWRRTAPMSKQPKSWRGCWVSM